MRIPGAKTRRFALWALGMGMAFASALGRAQAAPPRIAAVSPHPSQWTVDGTSLGQVTIQFDSQIVIGAIAVSARTVGDGPIGPVMVTPVGALTDSVTLTFPPVFEDRLTIVIADAVENAGGEELDGEIASPRNPVLPSGDDVIGGSAVLQFTVLQGDVNRDGLVDSLDFNLVRAAVNHYNTNADLNHDGVVNATDEAIVLLGAGKSIPKTDKVAPTVVSISPSTVPLPAQAVIVTFSEMMNAAAVTRRTVYLVGENGEYFSPSAEPTNEASVRFTFPFEQIACLQDYDVLVSNAAMDLSGEPLAPPAPHLLDGQDTTPPVIACPTVVFLNSTTPFGIPSEDVATHGALQEFLHMAMAEDECDAGPGGVQITNSLDSAGDVPLGVNPVTFTASDLAGNAASCAATVIVVQAIPLPGPAGAEGPKGEDGADGPQGEEGTACWDANGNGVGDPIEDRNDDGVVNVVDCEGVEGAAGADGQDGEDGSAGPAGPQGPAGDDGASGPGAGRPNAGGGGTGSGASVCGAAGMIPLVLLVLGLRLSRRDCVRRVIRVREARV